VKKSKVQKSAKSDDKKEIVDAKTMAVTMLATMKKENTGFSKDWSQFHLSYKDTMAVVEKYQKFVESTREELAKRREELLESMKEILPLLKSKLGSAASKFRMADIIAKNLEDVPGSSLSSIRRLIDRYEEKYGALFPSALEDKTDVDDMAEGKQNHIDILYDIFGKGKDELLALVKGMEEAIEDNRFERLVIKLNANRNKIQGFQLVVKEQAKS
jgi:hypothetical protein